MSYSNKSHAKKVLLIYGSGVLLAIIAYHTPFFIPCVWKWLTGIPCPACGITRAFLLAGQFRWVEAIQMNLLFLPLFFGMIAYFICAVVELCTNKYAIKWFNSILAKKWVIALVIALTALSWYYNIVRDICC